MIYCFTLVVHCTPQMKDLQNYITPHYATHWRVIGTQLGLPKGRLDIIEHDNYHKADYLKQTVVKP